MALPAGLRFVRGTKLAICFLPPFERCHHPWSATQVEVGPHNAGDDLGRVQHRSPWADPL